MGYAYLFALVVGVGILTIQALVGSKDADGGADEDIDLEGEADHDLELEGDHDFGDAGGDLDAEGDHDHDHLIDHGDGFGPADLVALFLSVRFWVFASLGFGLSGTLLTYLTGVAPAPTAITAIALGLVSGLAAALTFRVLKSSASAAAQDTRQVAIGRVGRVILPVAEERRGKIRVQISGQSVDLLAKSSGSPIARGDAVIIEEVDQDTALVSRAPDELQ